MDFRSLMPFGRHDITQRAEDGFTSLRREMDRLFDGFTREWAMPPGPAAGFITPKVDVVENEKGLVLTAELPGLEPKDISLDITGGILTLKAERKNEREEKDDKTQYHLVERSYGTFLRSFTLPFIADEEKVEAGFDKGVLTVTIPRATLPEKTVKKIEVKAG
jgi:HSP20 family protein